MLRWLVWVVFVSFAWACSVNLAVDEEARISCRDDGDCPIDWLCREDNVCASTKTFTNRRPTITIAPLASRYFDQVAVEYVLDDPDEDRCSIQVEFSLDRESWYPATEHATSSDGVSDLAADQTTHGFIWNAVHDAQAGVGSLSSTRVDTDGDGTPDTDVVTAVHGRQTYLRITPRDDIAGTPQVTSAFFLGNTAPVIRVDVEGGLQRQTVILDYGLTDESSDSCTLYVDYSIDNGATFKPASIRISASELASGILAGQPSDPLEIESFVIWDTRVDLPGDFDGDQVWLQITPFDGHAYGNADQTGPFALKNNTPPTLEIADLSVAIQHGLVEVPFVLTDASGDTCELKVEYQVGADTPSPASVTTPLSGISSSAGGTSGAFIWDSLADLGEATVSGVVLVVTPNDLDQGETVLSEPFDVDNQGPLFLSFTFYDTDENGSIDRVDALFSEAILPASLASGRREAFQTIIGQYPYFWEVGSSQDTVALLFGEISGTGATDLSYDAALGGLTDATGNQVPSAPLDTVTLIDAAAPRLLMANAREVFPGIDGIDTGDLVSIGFSESLSEVVLDAGNIDGLVSLSGGHSWLDGSGGMGGVTWIDGSRFEITLTTSGGLPSVSPGDTVSLATGTFVDIGNNEVANSVVVSGGFSRRWGEYLGFPPSGCDSPFVAYDPTGNQLVVMGGDCSPVNCPSIATFDLEANAWCLLRPGGTSPFSQSEHGDVTGAAGVVDTVNHRLILYGGYSGQNGMHTVDVPWSLDLTPGAESWSELSPAGTAPPGRRDHATVFDTLNRRMIVVGGQSLAGTTLTDIWSLDLSTSDGSWASINTTGDQPDEGLFEKPVVTYDTTRNRLILFGGETWALDLSPGEEQWVQLADTQALSRLIVYDGTNDRFVAYLGEQQAKALTADGSEGWGTIELLGDSAAEDISEYGAIYDPVGGRMVALVSESAAAMETLSIDLALGSERVTVTPVKTRPPDSASQHTAVFDAENTRMVVLMQQDGLSAAYGLSLTPGLEDWEALSLTAPPTGRYSASAVYDASNNRLLLFGGWNGSITYNDTWSLSLALGSEAWSCLTPGGIPPSARAYHVAVVDTANQRMLVFGGTDDSSVYALSLGATPTWSSIDPIGTGPTAYQNISAVYDPVNQQMVVFGGCAGEDAGSDELFLLSLVSSGSETWSQLTLEDGPTARYNHSAVYEEATHRMLVFGGQSSSYGERFAQLWALDLTAGSEAWEQLEYDIGPSGRADHSAVFDTSSVRMVVFGGKYNVTDETWWY